MQTIIKKTNVIKHKTSLIKETAVYVIADGINKAIPFLILPIIVRYLTPEDYGIITNYAILTQVIAVFIYGALQGSIPVVFFKYKKEELINYIITIFSLITTTTILLLGIFLLFSKQLEDVLSLSSNFIILSLAEVFLSAFTCINMLLWRCEEKATQFGIYQIIQTFISVVLTILLVVNLQWAWQGKIFANFVAISLMGCLSIYILHKKGYYKVKLNFTYSRMALSFAIPLIPHALALWGKTGIDKILITNLKGLAENGVYSTAITWGAIITIIITAFGNAFNPYLLKKLAVLSDNSFNDTQTYNEKRKLVKTTYLFILTLGAIILLSYFIFTILIKIIYPIEYHGSIIFLPWILLGEFFRGCYTLSVNYIHYTFRTKILGIITFGLCIIQFFLSYILINLIGTIGAAISTCLISFLTALCVFIYANRVYPMPWFSKK